MKDKHMKKLYKSLREYLNSKDILFCECTLILGFIISSFGYQEMHNFWYLLQANITTTGFLLCFFLVIGLNCISLKKYFTKNYFLLTRYDSKKAMQKDFYQKITFSTIVILLSTFLLNIAFSIFFAFGDFQFIPSNYEQIPILISIFLTFLRFSILSIFLSKIFATLLEFLPNVASSILFCIFLIGFFFLPIHTEINGLLEIPLLWYGYFLPVTYANITFEIVGSCWIILLLGVLFKILASLDSRKRRDIL